MAFTIKDAKKRTSDEKKQQRWLSTANSILGQTGDTSKAVQLANIAIKTPVAKGTAEPGAIVTRKVTKGPGLGDTVQFKANAAGTQHPGKLVPRRVINDGGIKNTQASLPHGKKKA